MKVLALTPFPVESASARCRLFQLVAPLQARGINLRVAPFLDSEGFGLLYRRSAWARTARALLRATASRATHLREASDADVLLVHREAMVFGPPVVEWLAMRIGACPLVLDLDDATYHRYRSPTYGNLASVVKWPGKTDRLIDWASLVTCGNATVAGYVSARGTPARVVPTVVDTTRFTPRPGPRDPVPVVGWIGSHSTYPYLERVLPVLRELARVHRFRLKVVGSGRDRLDVDGLDVECLPWRLEREVDDFRSLDIGLYPITEDVWSAGKSGFKAIQYMAVGIPFVVSPVGAAAGIGEPGVTQLAAASDDEWRDAIDRLLGDEALRRRMGEAGRAHVVERYTVDHAADALARALTDAARS